MSLLSRSASSRTTPASEVSRSSLATAARFAQHGRGAEDRGERRAQLVRHRADQRLAQQLGLRAHLGVVERARDVEAFERGGGVRQHVVDPLADLVERLRGHAAEIDGDDAEVGVLLRHAPHQPDVAVAVVHRGRGRAARLHLGDGRVQALRQAPSLGLAIAAAAGTEQHDIALDEIGEMLLDREVDLGGRWLPPPSRRENA